MKAEQKRFNWEQSYQNGKYFVVIWTSYWPRGRGFWVHYKTPLGMQIFLNGLLKCVTQRLELFVYKRRCCGNWFIGSHCILLLISEADSITSCYSGNGEEGKEEGSGSGMALIVFIVQRNSVPTFKAKTNSCERVEMTRGQNSLVCEKQHNLTPLLIHTRSITCVQWCPPRSPAIFTLVSVLCCINSTLFHEPPRLTAATSLPPVVKP